MSSFKKQKKYAIILKEVKNQRGKLAMVKIDLITGFLGSGKTTFIKKYAKYLLDKGMNIGILENDFGAVNVDMLLLQDLMGDNCELEMISGGCDKETHRRRFRTKLIDQARRHRVHIDQLIQIIGAIWKLNHVLTQTV